MGPPESPSAPLPRRTVVAILLLLSVISATGVFTMLLFSLPQQGPHPGAGALPVVTIAVSLQENPTPSLTTNGGGWRIEVTSVVGRAVVLSDLSVIAKRSDGSVVASLKPTSAPLQGNGSAHWYGQPSAKGASACRIVAAGGSAATPCDVQTDPSDLPTIEGVALVLVDADSDHHLGRHDVIHVFADGDADGALDLPTGVLVLQVDGTSLVGTSLA